MPGYELYLFGAPHLEHQDQPVSLDTRKALALLAYLLLTGEPQSRDTLATFFWPESGQKSARAALRRTLSALRGGVSEEFLDFGREIIAFHPGSDFWCDVISFQSRLDEIHEHGHPPEQVCERCLIPLQEAAELYKADFMAGFSLRDSAAFDDWQFFEADRLRRELAGVLERLVSIYHTRKDFQTALDTARRWLTLDLLNEAAHRALILLYAQSGQRNAALRQYRECVRILDQELGVPPLEETTQLYEAVKENRFKGMGSSKYMAGPGMPSYQEPDGVAPERDLTFPIADDPLIGRREELEALSNLYGQIDQDGVFAAITGEIGVGKSHLARKFIAQMERRGAKTLSVRCFAGESNLAYTPLIDLLRQGIARAGDRRWWQRLNPHWLAEISLLVPEISGLASEITAPKPTSEPGAQTRFFDAVCQALITLVQGNSPGILFIDNLEWADESTLDLVAYLARRLRGRPIMLLTAWGSEAQLTTIALDQLMMDTMLQGNGIHIALSPLQPDQARQLIEKFEPEDRVFSDSFKDHLTDITDGLPMMLVEYLQAALQGEFSIEMDAEYWPVPTGLRGLLQTRLAGLRSTAHQLLQAAAVIGHTFDIDLLQSTSGRSEEEIIQGIEELLAQNLVQEISDQNENGPTTLRYDFKHEQVREMLLEDLSLGRSRLLHRRAAEALEEYQRFYKIHPLSGQIAYHFQHAGASEAAAKYYFLAGQQDRGIHANADAITHFQAALALGYPEKPEILVELGDLYTLNGDYSQAIQQFEAAAAFDQPALLPVIEQKIGQVYLRLGQWEQAACHFEAALFDLGSLEPEQRRILEARNRADWSLASHRAGDSRKAAALAQEALALAEEENDPLALSQVHNLLGVLARASNQPDLALQHLEKSLAFTHEANSPSAQIAALNNLALVQADLGEYGRSIESIQSALDECKILGDRHLEAALRNNLADQLRASGDHEAAISQLKEAVTIFAEIGQRAEDWEPEIWKLVDW
ncbi:MAG: AAA family ATPase [Anaerolineales bacterium]